MRVSADDDHLQVRHQLLCAAYQLQAVASRHTDIRNQYVRLPGLNEFQRFQAILSQGRYLHAQGFPIRQGLDQPAYQSFIIRDNYF